MIAVRSDVSASDNKRIAAAMYIYQTTPSNLPCFRFARAANTSEDYSTRNFDSPDQLKVANTKECIVSSSLSSGQTLCKNTVSVSCIPHELWPVVNGLQWLVQPFYLDRWFSGYTYSAFNWGIYITYSYIRIGPFWLRYVSVHHAFIGSDNDL